MANRFDALIDAWDPVIRRAFLDSIFNMRDRAQVDQIARMIEAGQIDDALRAVGLDPTSFRPLDKAVSEAFEAGGNATAKLVPITSAPDGLRTVFQFGVRNIVAENWLRNHSSNLVREILDDQRAMIRGYLADGLARGVNPRTSALDLVGRISAATGKREGGALGLTSSQEEWVRKYAAELEAGDGAALSRKLRDRRFDRSVAKAAREGEPIPAELRAKMVRNYRNNALRFRAENLARTEAMAALHESQDQAINQAVGSGAVRADAVTGVWRVAIPRGKNARESHTPMHGQVARLGQPFTTGNGVQIMYPGDPNAPISETASCRCFRELKIDFLAGVR